MTDTPTKAVDVVGVYDVDLNQVFPGARPTKASIKNDATFFKHPLESSKTRTDHVIFLPIEIMMSVIMAGSDYKSVYQQIEQLYLNQTQLIVQTKVATYENIYIEGIPYEETPSNFDSVVMNLSLKETQFGTTEIIFSPENSADKNTKNRGQQGPKDPTNAQQQKGSTLYRWTR